MKEKTKRTKTNKPICSKNNNERVGAGFMPAHNKGITLIALILTIIVLLILAVVAINAVKGDGIIGHAKNAKTDYTKAQKNEQDMLSQYEYEIEKSQGKITGSYGEYAINKELNEKVPGLKLGDKVNYVATGTEYTGEWKVLGIENGQIQIVTASCPTNIDLDTSKQNNLWDEATQSYNGAVNELNLKCAEYGNGTGAESARSIKLEDIDKIIKGAKVGGNSSRIIYGDKVTYKVTTDRIQYKVNNDLEYKTLPEADGLVMPNGRKLQEGEEITAETTFEAIGDVSGLSATARKTLDIEWTEPYINDIYFVANSGTVVDNYSGLEYGIAYAYPREGIYGEFMCLWDACTKQYNTRRQTNGVRPVVSLASDVQLTETSEGSGEWSISK